MKLHIFHNIVWSKYKGGVFSEINRISPELGLNVKFTQIAETESDRMSI
jgi:hypothetical protein